MDDAPAPLPHADAAPPEPRPEPEAAERKKPFVKRRACEWYARGFCKHGKRCRNKHVYAAVCPLFLIGFCPYGPECYFVQSALAPDV